MSREQLAEASAVAAENGRIGSTGAMALAARLLNDRSSQAGAGENRCWDYSHITGMHNWALGRVCTPAAGRCGRPKAVSPDLRPLTGATALNCRAMLRANGIRRNADGEP